MNPLVSYKAATSTSVPQSIRALSSSTRVTHQARGLTYLSEWNGATHQHRMDHLACFMAGNLALGSVTSKDTARAARDLKTGKVGHDNIAIFVFIQQQLAKRGHLLPQKSLKLRSTVCEQRGDAKIFARQKQLHAPRVMLRVSQRVPTIPKQKSKPSAAFSLTAASNIPSPVRDSSTETRDNFSIKN